MNETVASSCSNSSERGLKGKTVGENSKEHFMKWCREQLIAINYPDVENLSECDLSVTLFKSDARHEALLAWISCNPLNVHIGPRKPGDDEWLTEIADVFYRFGFVTQEQSLGFIMGGMEENEQIGIWRMILESVNYAKTQTEYTTAQQISFLNEMLTDQNGLFAVLKKKKKIELSNPKEDTVGKNVDNQFMAIESKVDTKENETCDTENLIETVQNFDQFYNTQLKPHFTNLQMNSSEMFGQQIQEIHSNLNNVKNFADQRGNLVKLENKLLEEKVVPVEKNCDSQLTDVLEALESTGAFPN